MPLGPLMSEEQFKARRHLLIWGSAKVDNLVEFYKYQC